MIQENSLFIYVLIQQPSDQLQIQHEYTNKQYEEQTNKQTIQ